MPMSSSGDNSLTLPKNNNVEKRTDVQEVFALAKNESDRGYAHSLITGTLFPTSPLPEGTNSYTVERRGDGLYMLLAGSDAQTNKIMMPTGIYPRLIMCWIAEQIRKSSHGVTQTFDPETRTVTIPSISKMMSDLRIKTGGKSRKNFISQLYALLTSSIIMIKYVGGENNPHEMRSEPSPIATHVTVPRPENPRSYSHSTFVLNEAIYQSLAKESMPYIKAVMEYLISRGGSVMRFDLFLWLSDTAPRRQWPLPFSWEELKTRFGRNYSDEREFRRIFRKNIEEIKTVYPTLNYELTEKGITIKPSPKQIRTNGTLNIGS